MAGLLEGKGFAGDRGGVGDWTGYVAGYVAGGRCGRVVSDVNADGAEETLSAIKEAGGDGMFVHADVSRPDDVAALVAQVAVGLRAAGLRLQQRRHRRVHGRAVSTNTRKTSGTGSWISTSRACGSA